MMRHGGNAPLLDGLVVEHPRDGSRHTGQTQSKVVVASQRRPLASRDRERRKGEHEREDETGADGEVEFAGDARPPYFGDDRSELDKGH